jgi:hypothetical protein
MLTHLKANKKPSLEKEKFPIEISHSPITTMQFSLENSEMSKTQPINLVNKINHKKSASTTKYDKSKREQEERKNKVIVL